MPTKKNQPPEVVYQQPNNNGNQMTLFLSKKPLSCPLRRVFGPPKKVVKKPPRGKPCGQQVGGIELNWGVFCGNSAKTRGTFSHRKNVPESHSGDIRYRLGMYQIWGGIFDTFCFWIAWHKILCYIFFFVKSIVFVSKLKKMKFMFNFNFFKEWFLCQKCKFQHDKKFKKLKVEYWLKIDQKLIWNLHSKFAKKYGFMTQLKVDS